MKPKLDENGNVVLQDSKVVYLDENDKDVVLDVDGLYKKIQVVNTESATRKQKIRDFETKFKPFEDIEDLDTWMGDAKKALETVQNLDDKKLVDADKIDELKKQIKEAYDGKMKDLADGQLKEVNDLKGIILNKDSKIYNLLVSSEFSRSPFFSGEEPKTVLLPDIAESYFGKHFKVEENEAGELIVAGYIGEDRIPSRNNPGEPANFEESIAEVIDKYPMKDRILRAGNLGTGTHGNRDTGDNDIVSLKKKYQDAKAAGNMSLAIGLKNELYKKGITLL